MTQLVIVESPAKAKTIKKYLGKDFQVLASFGHVRDLLPKKGSVEPDEDFLMHYEVIERNRKHVDEIAKALKKSDSLLLATDPDREGEAISWHIHEIMKQKKLLKDKVVKRVVFHEITKSAIQSAVENARDIAMPLVNAQQARRALDYLVGFNLSPLLWKKVQRGLSAGRVQSPALRLIVERELEIEAFVPQEYWSINAACEKDSSSFNAKLHTYSAKRVKQFDINNADGAQSAKETLLKAANGSLDVLKVEKKQRKRNPAAPFITSTLQQEASRKLGFGASRTMRVAQQLYEGIEIGTESVGLISYMRTDSVHLANEAIEELRDLISKRYPTDLPDSPKFYKTKSKNAQEAHEAIRPTSCKRTPSLIKDYLNKDQLKLYELIWKRTVACQMKHATINTVSIDLQCGDTHLFRATGSTIADPGFMRVYLEGTDDNKDSGVAENLLPEMEQGDKVDLKDIITQQHFTEPPPRYGEASLVKSLEEHGIGRPSTYASIISTLQNRNYATLDKKRFIPSDVGRVVNKFLTDYFTNYVDYNFTAKLEDQLDAVARDEQEWKPVLENFWKPFIQLVDKIDETVKRSDVTTEVLEDECPKCSKPLSIRLGKRGRFIGCTGYPDCDYTSNLEGTPTHEHEVVADRKCPTCESDLIIREGKYGKFIGCSSYPDCKFIEPLEKPEDMGIVCPSCNTGSILKRKSRRGKIFFSCSGYPKCKYALWNEPVNKPCPKCSYQILTIKTTKRSGTEELCPNEGCDYKVKVEEES